MWEGLWRLVTPGKCFTDVLWAPQVILMKNVYCRYHTSYENFKLKICACVQSHALGTRTTFHLHWNPYHKCDFWHCIFSQNYHWRAHETLVKHSPGVTNRQLPSRIIIVTSESACWLLMPWCLFATIMMTWECRRISWMSHVMYSWIFCCCCCCLHKSTFPSPYGIDHYKSHNAPVPYITCTTL